jgi:hypothetical protein
MKTWDLHTPAAKLRQAMKDLHVAKNRIASQWQDDKLRQFEEAFLEPLEPKLRGTALAIAELAEVLHQAERAVGDY